MISGHSVYLRHIMDAAFRIEEYIKDMEYDEFMENKLVQDGVIRQLEIIGEATKRLSKDFTNRYSELPWKDIAGMRDKLIHGYFGVDLDAVWDTARGDIPELKSGIERIMHEEQHTL